MILPPKHAAGWTGPSSWAPKAALFRAIWGAALAVVLRAEQAAEAA